VLTPIPESRHPLTPRDGVNKTAALALVCLAQLMVIIDISCQSAPFDQERLPILVDRSAVGRERLYSGFAGSLAGAVGGGSLGRRAVLMKRSRSVHTGVTRLRPRALLHSAGRGASSPGLGGAMISLPLSHPHHTFPEGQERNGPSASGSVVGWRLAAVHPGWILSQGPGWRWVFFVTCPSAS